MNMEQRVFFNPDVLESSGPGFNIAASALYPDDLLDNVLTPTLSYAPHLPGHAFFYTGTGSPTTTSFSFGSFPVVPDPAVLSSADYLSIFQTMYAANSTFGFQESSAQFSQGSLVAYTVYLGNAHLTAVEAVPEPATSVLLGTTLLALLTWYRKRKRK